jgi:hypothetical protein
VTDHKGLEYFETQRNLSDRQVQWWEFLSCFNFTIMHIGGIDNKVADCLSHYYENDTGDQIQMRDCTLMVSCCPPTGTWS